MPLSVPLCPETDIPENEGRQFLVDDREIAVFRIEGALFALDGRCPHSGGPLGLGELIGRIVVCPWHGWSFDVPSGRCEILPDRAATVLPVRVEDGMVVVEIDEASTKPASFEP